MYEQIKKALDAGCPWKIIGNGGYPATLVSYDHYTDGEIMPIYRYPGGDVVQVDLFDGIKRGYISVVQQKPSEMEA